MKKPPLNLPASVRQRLLNLSHQSKQDFGLLLTKYALERLLYRLSVSKHRDVFVLKGALLFQLWISEPYRPTRDLDLLGQGVGSTERYHKIFTELCSIKVEDDGIALLADTIRVERIRDDEEYEGVRVLLEARLANARISLQIDVGFGDVVTPPPLELEYPTLLAFPAPRLRAYPKESVVAEKFEAMVKLGMANSRMKDFYDLWVMAEKFEFEGQVLSAAVKATFERRKTNLPASSPTAFTAEFCNAPTKQTQWNAFLKKSGLKGSESLADVVRIIDAFVMPSVEAIHTKKAFARSWRPGGPWRPSV